MIWVVWRDVALATVSPAKNLKVKEKRRVLVYCCYLWFHLDLDTRNMMEVASVCRAVSSPYSFHLQWGCFQFKFTSSDPLILLINLNVVVAMLSMMTKTALTTR